MIRTYSELIKLSTFKERYEYLRLQGAIGDETFGSNRYLNQKFYKSDAWLAVRDAVIIRDNGCDLAMPDRMIDGTILIHHMNPISVQDVIHGSDSLLNPEYLICVTKMTHNAIHYSDENILIPDLIERTKNDTCPWRK